MDGDWESSTYFVLILMDFGLIVDYSAPEFYFISFD